MPKTTIIHFFLEILYLKESCNLIFQQHLGLQLENLNFARYTIGGKISITILVIGKTNTKFFKISKKNILGQFWVLVAQVYTKMNFPGKKGSVSF